jgi:hypothetical protein
MKFPSEKLLSCRAESRYPGMLALSCAAGFLDFARNDIYEMLAGN